MELMKFVEQAKAAFAKAYTAIDNETATHNKAIANLRKVGSDYTKEAFDKKWDELQTGYASSIAGIRKELEETIDEIRSKYVAAVKAFYLPNGDDLSEGDLRLLKSGIALSAEELEMIAARNQDKVTMMRMLEQYASANRVEVSAPVNSAFHRAKAAGTEEQKAFVAFVQLAFACVNMASGNNAGTEAYIKAADKLEEYALYAEENILKAKVFRDEATMKRLAEIEEQIKAAHNDVTHGGDVII